MVRASHQSSKGCGYDPRLGLRNRFSENRAWRSFIYHLAILFVVSFYVERQHNVTETTSSTQLRPSTVFQRSASFRHNFAERWRLRCEDNTLYASCCVYENTNPCTTSYSYVTEAARRNCDVFLFRWAWLRGSCGAERLFRPSTTRKARFNYLIKFPSMVLSSRFKRTLVWLICYSSCSVFHLFLECFWELKVSWKLTLTGNNFL